MLGNSVIGPLIYIIPSDGELLPTRVIQGLHLHSLPSPEKKIRVRHDTSKESRDGQNRLLFNRRIQDIDRKCTWQCQSLKLGKIRGESERAFRSGNVFLSANWSRVNAGMRDRWKRVSMSKEVPGQSMKVFPTADVTAETIVERSIRSRHVDGESPDIWDVLEERFKKVLGFVQTILQWYARR